jgi:hypothetical protein
MQIHILSLLEPFDAPVPMDRARWLEGELACLAIDEARRIGIPRRCRVTFGQQHFAAIGKAVEAARAACASGPVVLLAPSDTGQGKELADAVSTLPTVVIHQNLDPSASRHPRGFRLGSGDRELKACAAAGLLKRRGVSGAVFVGTSAPASALSALPGLVTVDVPSDGTAPEVAPILAALGVCGVVLLECGGKRNRAIARATLMRSLWVPARRR